MKRLAASTVNGLEKTSSSIPHRILPALDDFVFINFSNPEKNFKRIEREKDPEKVQKGFDNTKEDLHTLGCLGCEHC